MKFWDSSAIVPLCVIEPFSQPVNEILKEDEVMIVWWTTRIECISALVRRSREGVLDIGGEEQARTALMKLTESWREVLPAQTLRETAERLVAVHPLRTADALQLSAALIWINKIPRGHSFVCLDRGLREAARKEGFRLLPQLDKVKGTLLP